MPIGTVLRKSNRAGFTMVEIAIALGVVAFALVAIIGILPMGLNVQRNNRLESIIAQDSTFWLDAIRNGARDLTDIVRQVKRIDITYDPDSPAERTETFDTFRDPWEIIGLLATPARANAEVNASIWSVSGVASEKEPDAADRELAFRYRLRVNIDRRPGNSLGFFDRPETEPRLQFTNDPPPFSPLVSLYDFRVTISYPLIRENPNDQLRYLSPSPTRSNTVRTAVSRSSPVLLTNNNVVYTFFTP